MFAWDKSIKQINVPAEQVVHLFRSMRDVQVALPGAAVQQASAYLCQYKMAQGVETVAVFHLLKTHQLAFYFSEPRQVSAEQSDNMLDQGLNFVESMGFLLSDLDIHLLDDNDRQMLWDSLPIKKGAPQPEAEPPATPVAKPAPPPETKVAEPQKTLKAPAAEKTAVAAPIKESAEPPKPVAAPKQETLKGGAEDSVDDLLAAVESMRAKRPGLRVRKKIPSPDEIKKRSVELRENLGRILSSL